MISTPSLRIVAIYIIISSVLFGIFRYLGIPYQFYIWEIFFDLKIIGLILLLLTLYLRGNVQWPSDVIAIRQGSVGNMILWFLFPLILFVITILAGLIFNGVEFKNRENAATLILATIFDIPAIFIFSITVVFIEEVFFRAIIVNSYRQTGKVWNSIIISAWYWIFFSLPDLLVFEDLSLLTIILLIINTGLIGIFNTLLVIRYKSIWYPYSMRIGIITLTPILISSMTAESDPFFEAKTALFSAEGIIFSILLTISIFIISSLNRRNISGFSPITLDKQHFS